jgi:hypothetical protein
VEETISRGFFLKEVHIQVDHKCNLPLWKDYPTLDVGTIWRCFCGGTWYLTRRDPVKIVARKRVGNLVWLPGEMPNE